MIEEAAAGRLGPELRPGEKLLWTGRPRPGFAFRASDRATTIVAVVWTAFAGFWEAIVYVSSDAPPGMLVVGALFIAMGCYLLFGRFILDILRRRRVVYGITDARALMVSEFGWRRVWSVELDEGLKIDFVAHPRGLGDIVFRPGGKGLAGLPLRFELLEDMDAVDAILVDVQRGNAVAGQ